jgi:hypothetical protein
MGWSLVNANDQHFATFRATDFFFLPLATGDRVIDSNLSRAKGAL